MNNQKTSLPSAFSGTSLESNENCSYCVGIEEEISETGISKPGRITPNLYAWLHRIRGKEENVLFCDLGDL